MFHDGINTITLNFTFTIPRFNQPYDISFPSVSCSDDARNEERDIEGNNKRITKEIREQIVKEMSEEILVGIYL